MKKTSLVILVVVGGLIGYNTQAATTAASPRMCTMEYAPVCGIDGVTYSNKCMAGGVKIKYSEICKNATQLKKACNDIYQPVCSVGNVTYGNKCMAGDVKVVYNQACKERIPHPNYIKNYTHIIRVGNTLYGDKKLVTTGKKTPQGAVLSNNWKLIKIGETVISKEVVMSLQVTSDDKVSGKAGCNSYFGSAELTAETIKFSQIGSTLMACDEARMKLESEFLKTISDTTFTYAVGDYELKLYQADKLIMSFEANK